MNSGQLVRKGTAESNHTGSRRGPSHILNPGQILEDKEVCEYDARKHTSQKATKQQLPAHFLQKGIIYLNYMPSSSSLVHPLLQLRADVQRPAVSAVF